MAFDMFYSSSIAASGIGITTRAVMRNKESGMSVGILMATARVVVFVALLALVAMGAYFFFR